MADSETGPDELQLYQISGDKVIGLNIVDETAGSAVTKQTTGDGNAGTSEKRHLVPNNDGVHHPTTNIPMTTANVIHSIIGSGIIGIPFAIRQGGLGLGLIFIVFVGILTDYTLMIMIKAGEHSNENTYQGLMRAAFGSVGFSLVTLTQFTFPVVAMISYNILAGDVISKLVTRIGGVFVDEISSSVLANRQFDIFLFTVIITLPLSLYRNISKLAKWSLLSTIFIVTTGVIVVIRLFTLGPTIPNKTPILQFANYGFAETAAIMATAYICNHNSFLMYESLEKASEKRWGIVVHSSIGFSMIAMIIYGVAGYATFTGFTQGDLLENYCYSDDLANVARVIYCLIMSLIYPVECFVAREVLELTFFPDSQPSPIWRHIVVTLGLVIFIMSVAMITDCLGIVMAINGALCAIPLGYIFPCLAYMKLRPESLKNWRNIAPMFIAVLGAIMAILGIVQGIIDLVDGGSCPSAVEEPYCLAAANVTT